MKKIFNSLILLAIVSCPVYAAPKNSGGPCPAFIANKVTKQMISGKNLVCGSSKIKGMKVGNVLSSGKVKAQSGVTMNESGSADSGVFEVGSKGITVEYSFDDGGSGKGGFEINLVDFSSDKVVQKLAKSTGAVDTTTTIINKPGIYFLRVIVKKPGTVCTGKGEERTCEAPSISYSITVGDGGDGGDDFDFGF